MRGLLAIEPLYHQIVAGKKTQTRRSGGLEVINDWPDEWKIAAAGFRPYPHNQISSVLFIRKGIKRGEMTDADSVILKPRYKIGEVLYLKEPTFLKTSWESEKEWLIYKYDCGMDNDARHNIKWSNKLFMPQVDARAFIRITGIRCERLLDISDEDCIAEGIEKIPMSVGLDNPNFKGLRTNFKVYTDHVALTSSCKISFLSLYKFANKVKEVPNLFVWVYEFTYLKDYQHA